MVIAIKNATGIDLHMAVSASAKMIRFRVTLEPPKLKKGERAGRLRAVKGHGVVNCREDIRAQIESSDMTIRIVDRRELIDKLDRDGQIDGKETYLELTLHLMN